MKVKAIFQSDGIIDFPKGLNGEEKFVIEHDGEPYKGNKSRYGSEATFNIPFRSNLLGFDFEYTVNLQFTAKRKHVMVTFDRADLFQVYKLLTSTFGVQFRLKSFFLWDDILQMWRQWPWNMDFLMLQFRHNPIQTLSFVKTHLPELITVMSLSKVPRQFNEPFKFIIWESKQAVFE